MALYFDSWLTELLVALALPLIAFYLWFSHSYTHWKKKGVPYAEPSFPFGNLRTSVLGQKPMFLVIAEIYNQFKGHRFCGMYGMRRPLLIVRDPELIRAVFVSEFSTFHDRSISVDESDPFSNNLVLLTGMKWKKLRTKLSPTFTSGKIKMMFDTMRVCGREMVTILEKRVDWREPVEMRELSARFTTDVIASVAFGIEIHSHENPDNEFRELGRKMFTPTLASRLMSLVQRNAPFIAKLLRPIANNDKIFYFFRNLVGETVKHREENNITRNDFMHLLIQLKNKGYVEMDDKKGNSAEELDPELMQWKMSLDTLTAQAVVFFVAGFETSSTTMSFALHELAVNPEVQRRLQEEIDATLKANGGDFTYDAIMGMKYLDKVVSETLRKHPPVGILTRESNAAYHIPGSEVVIDPRTMVNIPVYALHHDPQYYPEPDRFDPERFSDEAKASRHPYVYLPFGEGPRICIGMRFGLLQAKVGLAYLLSKLNVEMCEKTKRTLSYDPSSFILMSDVGIQLRLTRRISTK